MDLTASIRIGGIMLAFLLLVFRSRSTWFSADRLSSLGFGLAFCLFPSQMMEFQVVGDLNNNHFFLGRLYGAVLLSTVVLNFLTRETRDGTVPITIMMSRVFSCGVWLLALCYTNWGTTLGTRNIQWSEQCIYFSVLGVVLWLVGHLVHLLKSSDFSTYPQHNIRINSHMRIDAFLGMMQALLFLAFPDYIFSFLGGSGSGSQRPDVVHTHMVRVIGCQFLYSAMIALHAPGFLHEHDKQHHFISRIVESALFSAAVIAQSVFMYSVPSLQHILLSLLTLSPIVLNAVVGYFSDGTTLYRMRYSPKKNSKTD